MLRAVLRSVVTVERLDRLQIGVDRGQLALHQGLVAHLQCETETRDLQLSEFLEWIGLAGLERLSDNSSDPLERTIFLPRGSRHGSGPRRAARKCDACAGRPPCARRGVFREGDWRG